ncbi:hypothetical protein [Planctomycetes bacterium K23_9]|uniref:Uncharacterized protein n=1 Tax=Stieleria marina TaxID=1930275 RepID=A0A517NMK7_9BACT|nr:hypothetical protein K239x_02570 [Planctomycetes bacterium K23_9]
MSRFWPATTTSSKLLLLALLVIAFPFVYILSRRFFGAINDSPAYRHEMRGPLDATVQEHKRNQMSREAATSNQAGATPIYDVASPTD